MTSPSRKSRRITAWSTAIAISVAAPALAQSPADQPAPTTWQPYTPPTATPAPAPAAPRASVTIPDLPPLPSPVQLPKIVTYQKPAHAAQPLPAVKPREAVNPPPPPPLRNVPVAAPSAPVPARPAVMKRFPQTLGAQPAPMQPTPAPAPALPSTPEVQPGMPATATPPTGKIPTKEELFRLDSDVTIDQRIAKELKEASPRYQVLEKFPTAPLLVPPGTKYDAKTSSYEPMTLLREPNYVIHRRLYFEEMNSERAGWDAGPAQSVFSSLYFFRDTLLFPAKIGSGCRSPFDSSAGKCLPGNPTPFYLYPPSDLTVFGGFVGAAVITGTAVILP